MEKTGAGGLRLGGGGGTGRPGDVPLFLAGSARLRSGRLRAEGRHGGTAPRPPLAARQASGGGPAGPGQTCALFGSRSRLPRADTRPPRSDTKRPSNEPLWLRRPRHSIRTAASGVEDTRGSG